MKTRQQFIIDTLKPYFTGEMNRAQEHTEDGYLCTYLNKNGDKCALGQHMLDGEWQKCRGGASTLFSIYKPEEVLTPEAFQQGLSTKQWDSIQNVHDNMFNCHSEKYLAWCEDECEVDLTELRELMICKS